VCVCLVLKIDFCINYEGSVWVAVLLLCMLLIYTDWYAMEHQSLLMYKILCVMSIVDKLCDDLHPWMMCFSKKAG